MSGYLGRINRMSGRPSGRKKGKKREREWRKEKIEMLFNE